MEIEDVEELDGALIMNGYQSSKLGSAIKASLSGSSVFLALVMIILTLDYYSTFAFFTNKGENYMLFNDHTTLSKFFVALWHLTTIWFIALKVFILFVLLSFRYRRRTYSPSSPFALALRAQRWFEWKSDLLNRRLHCLVWGLLPLEFNNLRDICSEN